MWLAIIAVGAGSLVFRLVPLLVLERTKLNERHDRLIRHAGLAAITALIVVSTRQAATGSPVAPVLLAVAAGLVLAVRRASMIQLLVSGGAVYAGSAFILDLLAG